LLKQVMVLPFTVAVDAAGNMRDAAQGVYGRSLALALSEVLERPQELAATAATLTTQQPPGEGATAGEGFAWVWSGRQILSFEQACELPLPEGVGHLLYGASELTDRVRLRLFLVDQPRKALLLDHVVLRPRGELFAALEEAAQSVAQALEIELPAPRFPTRDVEAYVSWLRGRDVTAAYEAGVQVGDPARSFDDYLDAARRDPSFVDAEERLLSLALDFALGGQGPVQPAREACRRLLDQDPQAYRAHAALAEIALSLDRPEEAVAQLVELLAIKSDWWPAYERLGTALLRVGRYAEALGWFDRALAEKADEVDALHGRGVALAELGRLEEAVASWEKVLASGHEGAQLRENLAKALSALGRRSEARVHRARARELGGRGPLSLLRAFLRRFLPARRPEAE
jgi:tetratricopeptide (TPR) repeat protein